MRKKTILALIIAAVMVVSATAVFSQPRWWGVRSWVWDEDEDELVTLEGKITDAKRPIVTMDADGKECILHLGPSWYWKEKGYTLEEGQAVEVTGIVEEIEGKVHLYPQTIESEGKSIVLTDENGVPEWTRPTGGRGYGPDYGWRGRGPMYGWDGPSYGWRGRGPMYGWGGYGYCPMMQGGWGRGSRYYGW